MEDEIKESLDFLKLKEKTRCVGCKGKKERDSGNHYYCTACIEKQTEKQKELKKSQDFYKEHPELIPEGVFATRKIIR